MIVALVVVGVEVAVAVDAVAVDAVVAVVGAGAGYCHPTHYWLHPMIARAAVRGAALQEETLHD